MPLTNESIKSPARVRSRLAGLQGQRKRLASDRARCAAELARIDEYLAIAPQVDEALEKLSREMFGKLTELIERNLTVALQEVLEQNIVLKVEREFKRGTATMSFHIERDGQSEDIMKGQGGSVVNILSVGLRMLALTTLDKTKHQRF